MDTTALTMTLGEAGAGIATTIRSVQQNPGGRVPAVVPSRTTDSLLPFLISVPTPRIIKLAPGHRAAVTVGIKRNSGFLLPVELRLAASGQGFRATFASNGASVDSATMTLWAPESATPGLHAINLRGTAPGGHDSTKTLLVLVAR